VGQEASTPRRDDQRREQQNRCSEMQHHRPRLHLFFLRLRPQPRPTLFPYTTLFRSNSGASPASGRCSSGVVTGCPLGGHPVTTRSEEHTSELQSRGHLVCRLLLEKKNPYRPSPLPL